MYRSLNLAEDNILKQVISDRFALASTDRQYDWRESIPADKRKPMPDIIVTRGEKEHQFSLEDVADAIGESLTDLLVARSEDETSIFSDVNRNFVSQVAHAVAVSLTKALEDGDRLRLSESDLYLLIEKALLENEAYDVAKSLAFRRSLEKTGHVENGTSPHALPVRLIRRNGNVVPWSETKIEIAVRKAFLTIHENPEPAVDIAKAVTEMVRRGDQSFVHIEDVQDHVQEELMRQGHYKAAQHYILYRAERGRQRTEDEESAFEDLSQDSMIVVTTPDGDSSFWDGMELKKRIQFASIGLDLNLPEDEIERETPPLHRLGNFRQRPQSHHHPQRQNPHRERRGLRKIRRPHPPLLHLRGSPRLEHLHRRRRKTQRRPQSRLQEIPKARHRHQATQPRAS